MTDTKPALVNFIVETFPNECDMEFPYHKLPDASKSSCQGSKRRG